MFVEGATGDMIPVRIVHADPKYVTIEPIVISNYETVDLMYFVVIIDGRYINVSTAHVLNRGEVVMLAKY
jgi:hypothetical protein